MFVDSALEHEEADEFTIPVLPIGSTLRFELLAPWADARFIGLNAIEIFGADGTRPEVAAVSVDGGGERLSARAFDSLAVADERDRDFRRAAEFALLHDVSEHRRARHVDVRL